MSNAEKQRALRARMRKKGLKLIQLWVRPRDEARVKSLASRLLAKRRRKR